MEDSLVYTLVAGIFGLLIWGWVLYEIIKGASKSKQQIQLLKIQIRLLSELLVKSGVPTKRINDIIDLNKSYFDFKGIE